MKTRKEKISFLRGLLKGERQLYEIKEGRQIFLIRRSEAEVGIYRESPTGKVWTEDDVLKHKRGHPQDKIYKISIIHNCMYYSIN